MRYLVSVSKGAIASKAAVLILKELDRFDYRSSFFLYKSELEVSDGLRGELIRIRSTRQLKEQPEAVLSIGQKADLQIAKPFNKSKKYFFQISENYEDALKAIKTALRAYDRIFTDLPFLEKGDSVRYPGHFLSDVIRNSRLTPSERVDTQNMRVTCICSKKRDGLTARKMIEAAGKQIEWSIVPAESSNMESGDYLEACLQSMQQSNVVVVFSDMHELIAAYMSCPAVRISRGGLFRRRSRGIINRILENDYLPATPSKPGMALKAVRDLLDNHQLCADRLSRYQQAIEKLGANPVFRNLCQKLVEELESE